MELKKREEPERIALFGIPLDNVDMQGALGGIDRMIQRRQPCYVATANLDFAAQAEKDAELQRILWDADLVLCDGMPLVWSSKLLGTPLCERVAGSDIVLKLLETSGQKKYRIFLLGAEEKVLQAVQERCRKEFGTLICGSYAPPHVSLLEMNHEEILQRIRKTQPDILLVAMGCPKQEKWIYMNYQAAGVPCSIGIGASLDFVAGKFKRAPGWMRVTGAEWIFRLLQEPGRLFGRYFSDLIFLLKAFGRQWKAKSFFWQAGGGDFHDAAKFLEISPQQEVVHSPKVKA